MLSLILSGQQQRGDRQTDRETVMPYVRKSEAARETRISVRETCASRSMVPMSMETRFQQWMFFYRPHPRALHISLITHGSLSHATRGKHPSPASNRERERLRPRMPPSLSFPCT